VTSLAAFTIVSLAAASAGGDRPEPRGVQLVSAQVQAQVLQPAIVRQSTGPELDERGRPMPQISRHGRTVLVEYQ